MFVKPTCYSAANAQLLKLFLFCFVWTLRVKLCFSPMSWFISLSCGTWHYFFLFLHGTNKMNDPIEFVWFDAFSRNIVGLPLFCCSVVVLQRFCFWPNSKSPSLKIDLATSGNMWAFFRICMLRCENKLWCNLSDYPAALRLDSAWFFSFRLKHRARLVSPHQTVRQQVYMLRGHAPSEGRRHVLPEDSCSSSSTSSSSLWSFRAWMGEMHIKRFKYCNLNSQAANLDKRRPSRHDHAYRAMG